MNPKDTFTMLNIDVQVHQDRKRSIDESRGESADDEQSINCYKDYEFVLVVPKKLTKHAQEVIYLRQATPLRYHLEGRFGSRTHRIDDAHMGLPLTSFLPLDESKARLERACSQYEDLRKLVSSEGVKFFYKPYHEPASHKARPPPLIDARIHPEREPVGKCDNEFWKKFMRTLRSQATPELSQEFNRDIQTAASVHHINHLSIHKDRAQFTYAELFAGKPD